MSSIAEMTRLELAGLISSELRKAGIDVVLSGGSCVSIYSAEQYVSMDLDFVNTAFAKRSRIKSLMESLGFHEKSRYFAHKQTDYVVEFPSGPLAVGESPVMQIDEIDTSQGTLRILSPTDCVKDRLTWYYYDKDLECLRQAVLVAKHNSIDIEDIKKWSQAEGKQSSFSEIRKQLES